MKSCTLCKESKPLSDFYTNGPDGHYAHCKPCALRRLKERKSWPPGYRPVMATARMEVTQEYLLQRATPEPTTGCWLWTGLYRKNGYPRLRVGLKDPPVGRTMWKCVHGREIPNGMVVRHSCDTPGCINPDHLSIGTPKDNTSDAVKRGRLWAGFSDLCRKLTPDMRIAAVELSRLGLPDTTVSKFLGVSSPIIQRMRREHDIQHGRWDRSREAVAARAEKLRRWEMENAERVSQWEQAGTTNGASGRRVTTRGLP